MGFFWFFLIGWIIGIVDLICAVVKMKKKEKSWIHYVTALGIIIMTYVILFFGLEQGYVLTV